MLLSEVVPQTAWVELYNATPVTQTLQDWRLDDGIALTTPFTLTNQVLDPHGFVVIDDPALGQFEPGTLQLIRADGRIADMLVYTTIASGTTWSRYPVQGGGWQAGTPPTPGDFNRPAPATPTITSTDMTETEPASETPLAFASTAMLAAGSDHDVDPGNIQGMSLWWWLLPGGAVSAASLAGWLWYIRRQPTPATEPAPTEEPATD